MLAVKTILHPTDFSESSQHALGYAVSFAKEFGAKLCILHVVEDVPSAYYFEALEEPAQAEIMAAVEEYAREEMAKVLPPEVRGDVPTEYLHRHGSPFLEILRCANEIKADLIVCGTHGRTGLKHLIMGSVAENVVRQSPCPVFTVRHPKHKFEMPG